MIAAPVPCPLYRVSRRRAASLQSRTAQRGAALITAMVILLLLTIIGLAAFNTTSLEEKMAGNVQEATKAFEAAESGLAKAIGTGSSFDLYNTTTTEFTFGTDSKGGNATVTTKFLAWSPPKRGSGYSAINYNSANFDQKSAGATNTTSGKAVLHQGAAQIVNKE